MPSIRRSRCISRPVVAVLVLPSLCLPLLLAGCNRASAGTRATPVSAQEIASARPGVRRNMEAAIKTLSDLGVVVYEWSDSGGEIR